MTGIDILIVGGYGQVGQEVARILSRDPELEGRIVIAGRRIEKAQAFAEQLGTGARPMRLDVDAAHVREVLERTCVVVMCVDPPDGRFSEQCLRSGLHWVDVTADEKRLHRLEALAPIAQSHGATTVLSVGVCPGSTNLLAAYARTHLGELRRLDLFLMLSTGDTHGEAAIAWTLENFNATFEVPDGGGWIRSRSFGARARVRLPGEDRDRWGYRFNFPDQRVVARTLGVPSVSTWLLSDSRALTLGAALVARTGVSRLLDVPRLRRFAARSVGRMRPGSDACAVVVRAENRDGRSREYALTGRREASLTAHVAAEVVRELLAGHAPAGVHHLEQFVAPVAFLDRVRAGAPGSRLWL